MNALFAFSSICVRVVSFLWAQERLEL